MWGFIAAGVGAIASYKAQKRAFEAQQKAFKRQLELDRKNRELAKQDAANKFVDMSNAAEKAGINRLTALRATGGAGFGMYGGYTAKVPVLSRATFMETFGVSMVKTWATNKINEPIDTYNREIRELEKQQRQLDIKLAKQQLSTLKKPQNKMPAAGGNIGAPGSNIETTELPMTIQGLNTLVTGALSRVTQDAGGNYVDNEIRATTVPYTTRSGRVINLPGDEMDIGAIAIGTALEFGDGIIQLYNQSIGALSSTRFGKFAKRRFEQIRDLEQTATPPFSDPNWGN
jgi:hypothetical protein